MLPFVIRFTEILHHLFTFTPSPSVRFIQFVAPVPCLHSSSRRFDPLSLSVHRCVDPNVCACLTVLLILFMIERSPPTWSTLLYSEIWASCQHLLPTTPTPRAVLARSAISSSVDQCSAGALCIYCFVWASLRYCAVIPCILCIFDLSFIEIMTVGLGWILYWLDIIF